MPDSNAPAPTPWRFVAVKDIPEHNILTGDVVICGAGQPTRILRILRVLPVNNGLILNLLLQDMLTPVDGVIGTERPIVEAMAEATKREVAERANRKRLRVLR